MSLKSRHHRGPESCLLRRATSLYKIEEAVYKRDATSVSPLTQKYLEYRGWLDIASRTPTCQVHVAGHVNASAEWKPCRRVVAVSWGWRPVQLLNAKRIHANGTTCLLAPRGAVTQPRGVARAQWTESRRSFYMNISWPTGKRHWRPSQWIINEGWTGCPANKGV